MNTWQTFIQHQTKQNYFLKLTQFIDDRRKQGVTVYPPQDQVFSAFDFTPLSQTRVVILGQDPYHGPGQAHGLSFSVNKGVAIPPSLRNMYKELATDIEGFVAPEHGDLRHWAEQGVLLLNTVLTVEQGAAHSHAKQGWETFTDNAIKLLDEQEQAVIFVLWGAHAQKKASLIQAKQHHIVKGPHPSPLSAHRGFFGCKHFSTINKLLNDDNHASIDWHLPTMNPSLL